MGRQQPALPLLVEKPGRTQDEEPRRWHGQSVIRQVEVEYSDGRGTQEEVRFVVVHSSQLAQQQTQTHAVAQGKEAEAVADHVQRVQARWFACLSDAEAALAEYEGRGQGRRGRRPRPCARRPDADAEILQAYQEQHTTVEPGFRWIKNPAAISPVWLEKPERIAALVLRFRNENQADFLFPRLFTGRQL